MIEPKIRFKRDDGSSFPDWKRMSMSDIFKEIIDKNHPEMPVLSILQGVGTVLRDESDRNILYDKSNLKGYKAMKKDDFIIHLRTFEGGLECSNHDGISSPAYKILRTDKLVPTVYRAYFRSHDFIERKLSVAVTGIRDGKNIDMPTFWEIQMDIPSLPEQQKIADFLSNVDEVIAASEEEVVKLKELKKGCLQKMFPQGDAKVPEVRFPGFTGDWEQRKLGDLIKETREKTTVENEDTLLSCAIDGMFLNSELFSHFRGSSNIGYLKVKKNDLILSAQNLHLGNCNVNLRFEHGIISPAYKVYELVNCNSLFMQAWIKQDKTKDFFLKASTEGASVCRKNIVWEELYKQELPVPKMDEQMKIGQYFDNLNNLITLHQRECDKWKELKKGLLQQMFV